MHAIFLIVPHKKLDKTSYELSKGVGPNLKFLKVRGCLSKVGLPDFKRVNVGSKTSDNIFIVYDQNSAAYRFMSPNDQSICESRDAEFFEHIFSCRVMCKIMLLRLCLLILMLYLLLELFIMNMKMNLERVRDVELR